MAFKSLQSLDAETTVSLGGYNKKAKKENPTSIEGYYLGSKQVEDAKTKGKMNFIYYFQTAKGNTAVWGKTDMDKKMAGATEGAMTRITHTGFKPTKNGEMYVYSVEVDTNNTIEVAASTSGTVTNKGSSKKSEYTEHYEDAPELNEDEEIDNYDDEEASQTAALAQAESTAAARKAKVEALLNKGKTARK